MFGAATAVACSAESSAPETVGSSVAAESTQCVRGPYVDGIDVYDGTGSVDWSAVKASGVDFALIKATQGEYDTQATFAAHWAGAKGAGIARGAYHFFDPTIDGVAQADYFLGVVGPFEPGEIPPMLDIECPDGDPDCLYAGASGAEGASLIQARMNDWLSTVETKTGVTPLVYTFASYFSDNGVDTTGLSAYPLVIAYPSMETCLPIPSPWQTAAFWQDSWTASVSGVSGPVDTDRFLGSFSQFRAFLGARVPATVAPLGDAAQEEPSGGGREPDAARRPPVLAPPRTEPPAPALGSEPPEASTPAGGIGCRTGRSKRGSSLWILTVAAGVLAARRRFARLFGLSRGSEHGCR
jgi:lysozyme